MWNSSNTECVAADNRGRNFHFTLKAVKSFGFFLVYFLAKGEGAVNRDSVKNQIINVSAESKVASLKTPSCWLLYCKTASDFSVSERRWERTLEHSTGWYGLDNCLLLLHFIIWRKVIRTSRLFFQVSLPTARLSQNFPVLN